MWEGMDVRCDASGCMGGGWEGGGGGGVTHVMQGRSRMTIDPCILASLQCNVGGGGGWKLGGIFLMKVFEKA